MMKLESASKAAYVQGRKYVGAADGEDLQVNFRPGWSRTPQLDVIVGDGSFVEKVRGALDARKARTLQDKVVFVTFASFQGHVLDWGMKMIITKVIVPADLLGYQLVLLRIAEEIGARTAYYYDLLLRMRLAKELESGTGNPQTALCSLDRDVLSDAKTKVKAKAKAAGHASNQHGRSSSFNNNPQANKGGKATRKGTQGKGKGDAHSPSSSWRDNSSRSPYRKEKKDGKKGNYGWAGKDYKSDGNSGYKKW